MNSSAVSLAAQGTGSALGTCTRYRCSYCLQSCKDFHCICRHTDKRSGLSEATSACRDGHFISPSTGLPRTSPPGESSPIACSPHTEHKLEQNYGREAPSSSSLNVKSANVISSLSVIYLIYFLHHFHFFMQIISRAHIANIY